MSVRVWQDKPKIEKRTTTMKAIYEDEWWVIQEMRKFGPTMKFEVFKQESSVTPYGEIKRIQWIGNSIPGGDEMIIRFDLMEKRNSTSRE